jgi:hypothetical protein
MTLEIVLPTWHFQNLKEISVKGVLNTMELSIGIIYLLKQKANAINIFKRILNSQRVEADSP